MPRKELQKTSTGFQRHQKKPRTVRASTEKSVQKSVCSVHSQKKRLLSYQSGWVG